MPKEAGTLEHFQSPVTKGLNLPFPGAVRLGDTLYVSGQLGNRPGTLELVAGGIRAEARQALDNMRAALEAAGSSLAGVAKCTIFLADMADWPAFNEIYVELFSSAGAPLPARSALAAAGLALGARVELECIAAAAT